ncbi:hypothetical protein [Paludibacterium denitrificans]|uniref:Uncharacterized protein n=1 Tax=Paludibacterium denitrificans TaxID=2675226 RepID=A0A844GC22_9NEIS|nr:hypothetical protein [Paludibacterium denitrificans]MTD34023.1 hypothetical protein [Paludibacterium denitrificans]
MSITLSPATARRAPFASPGTLYPNSDFLEPDGTPKTFVVEFRYGKAEVADNLGRYLIDQGLAQESVILMAA